MVEVGIRELKADLSAYLKRAAAGEQIRVTMRGEPFVDLVQARAPKTAADTVALLDQLADAGVISRATGPRRRGPWPTFEMTGSPTADIVAERDRERRG